MKPKPPLTVRKARSLILLHREKITQLLKEVEQLRAFIVSKKGGLYPERIRLLRRNQRIFERYQRGMKPAELAKKYKLSAETIRRIVMRMQRRG
jgi:Mor family transcriptional regulator